MRRILSILVLVPLACFFADLSFAQSNRIDWNSQTKANPVADTGAADAYLVTLSPAPAAYSPGMPIVFKAAHTNTTTSTINANGLGAKTIKKQGGAADVVAGDIQANAVILLIYDGTNFQMQSPLGNAGGGVSITGTPASGNLTKFSGPSSITNGDLSGDVTTSGTLVTTLANTTVVPGSYVNSNITVDSKGRLTAATSGSGGLGGYNEVGPSPSSPPALASWTQVDSAGNATFLDRTGGVFIGSPGTAYNLKVLYLAAPGVPFTLIGRMQGTWVYREYSEYGLVVGDSSGKWEVMGFVYAGGVKSYSGKWNSDTSYNSDRLVTYLMGRESLPYFKVQYDGTNIIYSVSSSGLPSDWLQVISYGATTFLSGVNRIGFYVGKGTGGDNTMPVNVTCTYWNVTTP